MEVHNAESKSSATAAASVAGEAANHKENGNGNVGAAVTATHFSIEDSKVKITGTQTQSTITSYAPKDSILLLEDATLETLPDYCNQVFANIDMQKGAQSDLLIGLIYCVALESRFALSDLLAETELEPMYWGSTFHKKNVDKLARFPRMIKGNNENYVLKLSFYTRSGIKDVKLVGIPTGDSFVVTVTPDDFAPGYSICLPVSRFVLSSTRTQNIAARFRNLKQLAYEMKEQIFVPIKIYLAEVEQCDVYIGLCGMPEELLYLILRNLELKYVQNLSKTCCKIRCMCENYRALLARRRNESEQDISSTRASASSFLIHFNDMDH